jgi:hypothetical protein
MKYILTLSTLVFTLTAHAALNLENTKNAGEVNFLAVGKPAMVKIKGKSPAPATKAKIENDTLSVESTLVLNTLDTGIEMRDEHMKEKYLQTKEYPNAILKIEKISLPAGFEAKPVAIKDQKFDGVLNLHGKDQKVSGTYSLSDKLELTAQFNIKLSDYGIEIPEYLGIKVADSVVVDTSFPLTKKN